MQNKNIIIGITGGIAAYKSLTLIRLFVKNGNNVKVIATKNALQFITQLSIETLSKNRLHHDMFDLNFEHAIDHISLSDWADAVVIAPASANIIGKFANGIADDLLSTFFLSLAKPIFIAPAMNTNMYNNITVQKNIATLKLNRCHVIDPAYGELACGVTATGRMEEPEIIYKKVCAFLQIDGKFAGKKVLVTAGPTYEPIDPVRFIGNRSSGLMGISIADSFINYGATVTLISGPSSIASSNVVNRINVNTAEEMYNEVMAIHKNYDMIVMCAAVADYTSVHIAKEKIKKTDKDIILRLTKTKDILADLGKNKPKSQTLVGFALESENECENAIKKLKSKNLDFIILNSIRDKDAGFNSKTNKVTIIDNKLKKVTIDLKPKNEIANDIVSFLSFHC